MCLRDRSATQRVPLVALFDHLHNTECDCMHAATKGSYAAWQAGMFVVVSLNLIFELGLTLFATLSNA